MFAGGSVSKQCPAPNFLFFSFVSGADGSLISFSPNGSSKVFLSFLSRPPFYFGPALEYRTPLCGHTFPMIPLFLSLQTDPSSGHRGFAQPVPPGGGFGFSISLLSKSFFFFLSRFFV